MTKKRKIEIVIAIIEILNNSKKYSKFICTTFSLITIYEEKIESFKELKELIDFIMNELNGSIVWNFTGIVTNHPFSNEREYYSFVNNLRVIIMTDFLKELKKSTKAKPVDVTKYTKEYLTSILN